MASTGQSKVDQLLSAAKSSATGKPIASPQAGSLRKTSSKQPLLGTRLRKKGKMRLRMPLKPKRALSSYMVFCNKYRGDVIDEMRAKWGSVELPDMARELADRWSDLEDKDKKQFQRKAAKRKETQQSKMEVYQAATDPIGYLKKKHEHLIPKRPACAYFLFIAEPSQRLKAQQLLKNADGNEEGRINSKLAEVWKSLSAEERAVYDQQYASEKVEFDKKMLVWQQTKQFREIDALEKKQKEAERAEKRKQKEAEEAEMEKLLKDGAKPGTGLLPGRTALITGLQSQAQLNGTQVNLMEFLEESGRWVVTMVENASADPMNIRPVNLVYAVLFKEAEKVAKKVEKKEAEDAIKREHREVGRAARAEDAIKREHREVG